MQYLVLQITNERDPGMYTVSRFWYGSELHGRFSHLIVNLRVMVSSSGRLS